MKNGIRCFVIAAALAAPTLPAFHAVAAGDKADTDTGGDKGAGGSSGGSKKSKNSKKKKSGGAAGESGGGGNP